MKYTQEDLANAIAVLSDADLEDGEIDQVDEMIICFAQEKLAVEAILDGEEAGEMEEEEADTAIASAITEHAEKRLEVFDLEIDLIEAPEDYEDYSGAGNETISFSQALGGTISNLIQSDYSDPNLGKQAIANATGLSVSDVDRIILGQAVPDTDTANAMTACFSVTSKDAGFKEFMNLAANAQNEVAEFNHDSSATPIEVLQNSAEINSMKAELDSLRQQEQLSFSLRSLERKADELVTSGNLTPWEKKKLFGETLDKEEGLALFSAACSANGVSTDTQIDRIRYYLSVAADRGQAIQFSLPVETPIDQVVDPLEQEKADDYFKRNGIG